MPDKSETYSVEGDNAELRHYLARWDATHAVSLVVLTHSVELFNSLFTPGTVGNSSNSSFHNIKLMS